MTGPDPRSEESYLGLFLNVWVWGGVLAACGN